MLVDRGIWIRQRGCTILETLQTSRTAKEMISETWGAKVRMGGDFSNLQFLEMENKSKIRKLVDKTVPGATLESLLMMADLHTHRRSWMAKEFENGQSSEQSGIGIDLDEVSSPNSHEGRETFLHEVGELEMTQKIPATGNDEAGDRAKRDAANFMQKHLDGFMAKYPALFPCSPKVKGKLSAYFEWKAGKKGHDGGAIR